MEPDQPGLQDTARSAFWTTEPATEIIVIQKTNDDIAIPRLELPVLSHLIRLITSPNAITVRPNHKKPRNFVTVMPLTLSAGMGYAEEITVDENTIDMITKIKAISNS